MRLPTRTEAELARLAGEIFGAAYAIKDHDDGSPNAVSVGFLASGMALAARRVNQTLKRLEIERRLR